MYRVKIDTVSSLEFGPLFDGALVGEAELAEAVRLTAVSFDFSIIKTTLRTENSAMKENLRIFVFSLKPPMF